MAASTTTAAELRELTDEELTLRVREAKEEAAWFDNLQEEEQKRLKNERRQLAQEQEARRKREAEKRQDEHEDSWADRLHPSGWSKPPGWTGETEQEPGEEEGEDEEAEEEEE